MKEKIFSAFIFCALIFMQGCSGSKPKVAVYVTGKIEPKEIKVLNSEILNVFVNSEKYEMVERSDAVLDEIVREHEKQRSGDVDTNEIIELGKWRSVHFVCVANVIEAYGSKNVYARLIDLEKAGSVASGKATSELKTIEDVKKVSSEVTKDMIKKTYKREKKKENKVKTENKNTKNKTNEEEIKAEEKAETKPEEKPIVVVNKTPPPPPPNTFTDNRNRKEYKTVKIGNLTWMAENLNHKIDNSWCYSFENSKCEKYGRLYDWYSAEYACPKEQGWRLPSKNEWNELVNFRGEFSVPLGGARDDYGSFEGIDEFGAWWTADEYGSSSAYYIDDEYNIKSQDKDYGFSVRCVKDD